MIKFNLDDCLFFTSGFSIHHPKIRLVPDVGLPLHLHPVHVGIGRAFAAPGEHVLQQAFVALEQGLNPAVREVPGPAGEPPGPGLVPGGGPEEHPLDPAFDQDMDPHFICHEPLLKLNEMPIRDIMITAVN